MHILPQLLQKTKVRRLFIILFTFAIFFGSLIVPIESRHPHPLIANYFDATWWTVTTITTVGYGDFVPVTQTGKALGMILQIFGVLIYSSIIATISMTLNKKQEEYYQQRMLERLDRIEGKLDKLSKESQYLIKNQD
ncbi:MAG: two pore domain potassium channel family protein [Candidatus Pacebacteria bacterium]|nr:two pore domain potassium channel family protein [Candidatus Paceibacterota bacterium]